MGNNYKEIKVKNIKRYESLDVLRGLCALSILFYHYLGWTLGHFSASNVIGRFGVYGVSMFYVLSGLTMYLVYFNKFSFSFSFFREFYIKRFFRIYPLMVFVVLLSYFLFGTKNSWQEQLMIITGLFSVLKWDAATPLGMWSIGNELSFYLLLPFIFVSLKKGLVPTFVISILIFGAYLYFAFVVLNFPQQTVTEDRDYKNPLNQAGLFLGGILIGHIFKKKDFTRNQMLATLIFFCLAYCFYPSSGELKNIYIGIERVVYTLICFGIALSMFKIDIGEVRGKYKKPFLILGEISYSLYLMHGVIWGIVVLTGIKIRYVLPLSTLLTFIASYFVYRYIESPIRDLGYKLVPRPQDSNITAKI
jgi:exopolysaccharide production protein ExoZ